MRLLQSVYVVKVDQKVHKYPELNVESMQSKDFKMWEVIIEYLTKACKLKFKHESMK